MNESKIEPLLDALHRAHQGNGYAGLTAVHPVCVQDQLAEHQLTEFEIYEFSDGSAKIMTRSEFDQAHGKSLRVHLEQARATRRLNDNQCNATFG